MEWEFLVLLVVMVPVLFLPPAFLLLRPRDVDRDEKRLYEEQGEGDKEAKRWTG